MIEPVPATSFLVVYDPPPSPPTVNDLVDRVRDVKPPFFMTHTSPWSILSFFAGRVVKILSTFIAAVSPFVEEKVKEIATKIHALAVYWGNALIEDKNISGGCQWLLSQLTFDKGFSEKIAIEQKVLFHKTGNSLCSEAGKVFAKYTSEYLKHHVEHAKKIDQEIRPSWLSSIVSGEKEETRYTFVGKQSALYLKRNGELVNQVIELNTLKVLSRIVDCLHKVQNESRFALLDLLQDSLSKGAAHFSECHLRASAQKEGSDSLALEVEEDQTKQEYRQLFFKTLSNALLNIGLPNKEKDLELPLYPFLASYLSGYVFHVMKEKMVPVILEMAFSMLETPAVKDAIATKWFTLLHELVDKEYQPYEEGQVEIHYPEQAKLAKSLEECLLNFIDYVDASSMSWIFKTFTPKKMVEASGESITVQLQSITLQDLFMEALEMVAPLLNPEGYWVEEEGQKYFQLAPFLFEDTVAARKASAEVYEAIAIEQRKNLEALVAKIGSEGKGLMQAAQDKVFAVTSTATASQPKEKEAVNWFSFEGLARGLTEFYQKTSEIVVKNGFQFIGVTQKVQGLSKATLEKMSRSEHQQIYYHMSESLMKILGQKVAFPMLKTSQDKQKEQTVC